MSLQPTPQEKDFEMLVLSRKLNESIIISDDIKITVVKISGGVVRLGIDAPKEVPIVRSELISNKKDRKCSQDHVLIAENN